MKQASNSPSNQRSKYKLTSTHIANSLGEQQQQPSFESLDAFSSDPSNISTSPTISPSNSSGSLSSLASSGSSSSTTSPVQPAQRKSLRYVDFLDISSSVIAHALTTCEHQLFLNVKPTDFLTRIKWLKKDPNNNNNNSPPPSNDRPSPLSSAISKDDSSNVSPSLATTPTTTTTPTNIDRMISWFNKISFWVTTEIVTRGDRTEQLEALEKFIELGKASIKIYLIIELLSSSSSNSFLSIHCTLYPPITTAMRVVE